MRNCSLENDEYLFEYLNFNEKVYNELLAENGLEKTWDIILNWLNVEGKENFEKFITELYDLGRLYEIGLAFVNKKSKKECGKYYTPSDVSKVMSEFFVEKYDFGPIADCGCGCGNLIIELLSILKKRKKSSFDELVKNRMIYLYDQDEQAVKICISKIKSIFGESISSSINVKIHDFLDEEVVLPDNINVITNPPYSVIKSENFSPCWKNLPCFIQSKDLYIGFCEKIIEKANLTVIVSPQSFLVGDKFKQFRVTLNEKYYGEIYSFDNVPGTLFDGSKKGVFNTNTSNGVRAAITVASKKTDKKKGFKLTHLIRFKSVERAELIKKSVLKSKLGSKGQDLTKPLKIFKNLETFSYNILSKSNLTIKNLIETKSSDFNDSLKLTVSTSSRYFTVVSKDDLKRNGKFYVYAKDKQCYDILYALLNSSYCYMWWRFLDGGILFSKTLFLSIPLPTVGEEMLNEISKVNKDVLGKESIYKCYKKNANELQESIKIPDNIREQYNKILFGNIDFSIVHRNNEGGIE